MLPPEADPSAERESLRRDILRRFEAWLDGALATEAPPDGVAAEIFSELQRGAEGDEAPLSSGGADLYSLWSAMTALTQEVKLQGRSFKQLADLLSPEQREKEKEIAREVELRTRREMLEILLDLRDRLDRGLDSASAHLEEARRTLAGRGPRRMWVRLSGQEGRLRRILESASALETGYRLSLERLEDSLDRLGVQEIASEGERFDPESMKAVEVEEAEDVEEGTVLGVHRRGYSWKGAILRPAEVKVARGAAGEDEG
jgi:molecular chaperone GrpE